MLVHCTYGRIPSLLPYGIYTRRFISNSFFFFNDYGSINIQFIKKNQFFEVSALFEHKNQITFLNNNITIGVLDSYGFFIFEWFYHSLVRYVLLLTLVI